MTARIGSKFQFSLLTVVVLSLEFGALLLLSFPVNSRRIWSPDPRMRDDTVLRQAWGWPLKLIEFDVAAGPPKPGEYVAGYYDKRSDQLLTAVFVDGLVGFLLLAATFAILEKKLRQKQLQTQSRLRRHILTVVIVVSLVVLYFIPLIGVDGELANQKKWALAVVGFAFEFCCWQGITGPSFSFRQHENAVQAKARADFPV